MGMGPEQAVGQSMGFDPYGGDVLGGGRAATGADAYDF